MRHPFFLICLMTACCGALQAQEAPIEVNPNRPTFASPSLTTQPGLAEVEFGIQQSYLRDENTTFITPTLLKLGIVKDFEIRLSSNGYLRYGFPDAPSVSGSADLALGAQWCFIHDGLLGTDMAVQFTHKFATANAEKGLGSGEADNTLGFFISRDFGKNHVDINFFETWLGQEGGGTVRQPAAALSVSHAFTDVWSMGGEVYTISGTRVGSRIVSNLWYVGYKVSSRLVLDTGVDIGLNQGAQKYSLFAGLTYGVGRFRRP